MLLCPREAPRQTPELLGRSEIRLLGLWKAWKPRLRSPETSSSWAPGRPRNKAALEGPKRGSPGPLGAPETKRFLGPWKHYFPRISEAPEALVSLNQ